MKLAGSNAPPQRRTHGVKGISWTFLVAETADWDGVDILIRPQHQNHSDSPQESWSQRTGLELVRSVLVQCVLDVLDAMVTSRSFFVTSCVIPCLRNCGLFGSAFLSSEQAAFLPLQNHHERHEIQTLHKGAGRSLFTGA